MKVLAVDFLRSAASADDFPRDGLPQLAVVGRSNVGKSTLINALVKRIVARTSAAPGKTRHVNLFRVTLAAGAGLDRFFLADLPGYGYARGGRAAQLEFEALTRDYFACPAAERDAPRGIPLGPTAVIQLVDARHPGLDTDLGAHAWLMAQDRPVAVVATKIDKLTRAERVRAKQIWNNSLNTPVLPVSAASGEGLEDLWTLIVKLLRPEAA